MPPRVLLSHLIRTVTGGFASTSVIVPDQPPSMSAEKSGSRMPDFTRTFAPVWKRTASDGFLGLGMTWYSLEIDSRMRKRGFEVGDAGQEDGVCLMVMVGEEDELVPVVPSGPELEKLVQTVRFRGSLHPDHASLQIGDPVVLRLTDQNIGRGEDDVVGRKLGDQWRQEPNEPEFPLFASVARAAVADELPVGDQFPQTDVIILHPLVLVDPHAGLAHPSESLQLIRGHADRVVGFDEATRQRVGCLTDPVVQERPAGKETRRERAHRWTRGQILLLGAPDLLGIRSHLGESGDVFREDRRDVVDEDVGGVNGVVPLCDQLGDVRGWGLRSPPVGGTSFVARWSQRRQLSMKPPADLAHHPPASVMLPKFLVHLVHGELLRVELASDPFHHFIVILMVWVTDGFEELGIAPDASHILRWTRSRPFEAAGVRNPRLRLQDFLKDDLVLPAVAKVILVDDPGCVLARVDLAEADAILVLDLHIVVVVRGFPKVLPVHDELVKMGIPPVHDNLKDFVKFAQRAIRHLNPPPYRRVTLIQRHLELIDGTSLIDRLAFIHEVLHHEVRKEVADLVEDDVELLPVSGWDIDERGVYLIAHLLQFLLRELDELLILGCLLDPGLEPHRKSSCLHHRFPLLHGQLERELFVWLLPVLGWHDSSSISRSRGVIGPPFNSAVAHWEITGFRVSGIGSPRITSVNRESALAGHLP